MISEVDTMLFNLEQDISEQNDVSGDHPQRQANLLESLEAWETDVMSRVNLKTD